jgi:hypothetical protein
VKTESDKETRLLCEVECPSCGAQFLFRRSRYPRLDSSGFESYELTCRFCETRLSGVIDPFDGTLLLSVADAAAMRESKGAA